MTILPVFSVLTANILGNFNDPFEFQGSYGSSVDAIRQKVFDLVISEEALARNLSDDEVRFLLQDSRATDQAIRAHRETLIEQAISNETRQGPTFSEIVPDDLLRELQEKIGPEAEPLRSLRNRSSSGEVVKKLDLFG